MAAPSGQLPVARYLGALVGILAVLYALVFFTGDSPNPRLGLDLQGGTTVTLQVGRGGTVFGSTSCVVSSQHEVIEAVYDEGFGLDAFSFYCTTALDRQWGCLTGDGPLCP